MIPRHRTLRTNDQLTAEQVFHGLLFATVTLVAISVLMTVNLLPRVNEYHEGEVSQTNATARMVRVIRVGGRSWEFDAGVMARVRLRPRAE